MGAILSGPLVFRRAASLGRIFFVTLSVDAPCIAGAGWVAAQRDPHAIVPLVIILSLDRTLTLASTSLIEVAQNSASSAVDGCGATGCARAVDDSGARL